MRSLFLKTFAQNCGWIKRNVFFSVMARSMQNCSVRRQLKISKWRVLVWFMQNKFDSFIDLSSRMHRLHYVLRDHLAHPPLHVAQGVPEGQKIHDTAQCLGQYAVDHHSLQMHPSSVSPLQLKHVYQSWLPQHGHNMTGHSVSSVARYGSLADSHMGYGNLQIYLIIWD